MAKTTKTTNPPKPDLEVARINSRQAIVVAIVSAVSGLIGAGITAYVTVAKADKPPETHKVSSNDTPAEQYWLVVKSIKLTESGKKYPYNGMRLSVAVNGETLISYPAAHLWAPIKDGIAQERFPLPQGIANVNLNASAILLDSPLLDRESKSSNGQPRDRDLEETIRYVHYVTEAKTQNSVFVDAKDFPAIDKEFQLLKSTNGQWGDQLATITFSILRAKDAK